MTNLEMPAIIGGNECKSYVCEIRLCNVGYAINYHNPKIRKTNC
jgi:hypothetical protein